LAPDATFPPFLTFWLVELPEELLVSTLNLCRAARLGLEVAPEEEEGL
jgi:hypothetical protein